MDKSIWRRQTAWFHWGEPWKFRAPFLSKAFGDMRNLDLLIRHQKSLPSLWSDLATIGHSCPKISSLALTVNIIEAPTSEAAEEQPPAETEAMENDAGAAPP